MTGALHSGYWSDLTTTDLAEVDPEAVIALLPVGATEQHGPHLPLGTDTMINRGIVARLLERLPDEPTLLVLPTMPLGDSAEHGDFPGTLSLSAELMIGIWSELGAAVAEAGLRMLMILNSHGGQTQIVDIVAQRLRMEWGMLVARTSYFHLGTPDGLFDAAELEHGLHGGAVETSLMLHLHPELVRREALADFESASLGMVRDYEMLRPEGPGAFAWASQDLHPSGATGDATGASAEAGARLLAHIVERLIVLLKDLRRAPLSLLREGPGSVT